MSPHVVPKAQASSPFGDDEEKTTIESGWEEEASTTVEQGEVADKIRALGLPRSNVTGVTNTNAGMLDEPTVDDQRANAALSLITPPQLSMNARLVITAGNDAGQHLDVTPGKSYTIGRAVDNDLVLTDIAVSRKHFDLRFENGVWFIADRGSGNGTVVNNQIEDAPFTLANGDSIEIGNTQFRIEIPNGPARIVRAAASAAMHDEDEPSTVASKPLREETPDPSPPVITPLGGHGRPERPKTAPPPPPLRARSASQAPPPPPAPLHLNGTFPPGATTPMQPSSYAAQSPSSGMQSMSTPMRGSGVGASLAPLPPAPLAAMQARPPMAPTMLGDAMGMPLGPGQMQGGLPASTIPGQGPPLAPSQLPPDMFGYPTSAQMPRQLAAAPNGHVIINGVAVRDATSTALVPPTPYNGMPHVMVPQPTYNTSFSRRMKLILGGAALTLIAAIATVGIIKGGDGKPQSANVATPPPETKPSTTITPIDDKPKATVPPPQKSTVPKVETPKVETPKVDASKVETKPEVAKVSPTVAPKVETPTPKVETTAKIVEQPKVETKPETKKTEPKVETKAIAVSEPKKTEVRSEPKKTEKKKIEKVSRTEPKAPEVKEPRVEKKAKTTAFDPSGAKNKADEQYRAKQFTAAASTLKTAAKSASAEDATSLNSLAAVYQQFGAAYNVGMAAGTKPVEAFDRLRKAQSLDNSAGKAFSDEIQGQLAKVAPRAAVAFMGAKEWTRAKQAVAVAEATGGGNDTTKEVKKALEREAGVIYKEAMGILSSDAAGAKDKLKQIRGMVDASSPWAAKAQAQLNKM